MSHATPTHIPNFSSSSPSATLPLTGGSSHPPTAAGPDATPSDLEPAETAEPVGASLDADPTPAPDAIPARWLALLACVVFVVRFGIAARRAWPSLYPDEPATFAMARWLSGGVRWNMFGHDTWQPGLATLLVPVNVLTDDPQVLYRSALAILALMAAGSAVLLARLTQRLTGVTASTSVVVAGIVALAPSGISATAFVWAEAPVTLTFLVVTWATIGYFDRPTSSRACRVVAVAAAGYLFHNRVLPLLAVVALVLVADQLRRRRLGGAAIVAAVAVGGAGAVRAYAAFIVRHVWDDPMSTNTATSTLSRVAKIDGAPIAVGQLWYQLVATAGVFGFGAIVCLRRAARRDRIGRDHRIVALYTLAMMGVSVLFLIGRRRGDYYIYGRYNDAIMWPVLAIGVAWLLGVSLPGERRVGARRVVIPVALATAVSGVVTWALYQDRFADEQFVPHMVPGLVAYIARGDIHILWLTLGGVGVLGFLVGVSAIEHPRRNQLLAFIGVVLLSVGALRTDAGVGTAYAHTRTGAQSAAIRELVPVGEPFAVRWVDPQRDRPAPRLLPGGFSRRMQDYQFVLVGSQFTVISTFGERSDIRYVFAATDDPVMQAGGARAIWEDPVLPLSLWDRTPEAD